MATNLVATVVVAAVPVLLVAACGSPPVAVPAIVAPCGGKIDGKLIEAAYGTLHKHGEIFEYPKRVEGVLTCRPAVSGKPLIEAFKLGMGGLSDFDKEITSLVGLSGTSDESSAIVFRKCRVNGEEITVVGRASQDSDVSLDVPHRNAQARVAIRAANLFAEYVRCQGAPLPDIRAAVDPRQIVPTLRVPQLTVGKPVCGWINPATLTSTVSGGPVTIDQTPVRSTPAEFCRVSTPENQFRFVALRSPLVDHSHLVSGWLDVGGPAPETSPVPGLTVPSGLSEKRPRNAWIETSCKGQPVVYAVASDNDAVPMATTAKAVITQVEKRDGCELSFE